MKGATLRRRHLPLLLVIVFLVALSANATDFWLAKDWHQWSKRECGEMLADSPWAHTWKGGRAEMVTPAATFDPRPNAPPDARLGSASGTDLSLGDLLVYSVQLLSSLPVRQAIVRQKQLDQNYDNMTDAQRSSFDAQAASMINRNFDDTILVRVDFSSVAARTLLAAQRHAVLQNKDALNVSLLAEGGLQVKATLVTVNPQAFTFDAVFPRLADGAPIIKSGQKQFSIRFQSPLILVYKDVDIPALQVQVKFDLSKMIVAGKLNY